jgi:hypothetical protein
MSLRFEPGTAGFLEAVASLESDAPTGPHDILLFGEAANAPELLVELDGQELLFPRVTVPEAPFEDRITLRFDTSTVLPRKISVNCITWARASPS